MSLRFLLSLAVCLSYTATPLHAEPADGSIPVVGFYEGSEVCTEVVNRAVENLFANANKQCPKGYREVGPERDPSQVYDPSKTPRFGVCHQETPESEVRSYRIQMIIECKG